ncbi:MAG TPA: hypothetical protein VMT47_08095, partial [Polyangia bacterium]|nr:hypothetical protein [Polyangia bacterium]
LINPLTFFYKPNRPLADTEDHVIFEASRYLRRLRDVDAWRKLFRRGVDLRIAGRTLTRFFANRLRGRAQELARRAGVKIGDDLAHELTTLVEKNIALGFVFSAGDPGVELLRTHGGPTVERLRRAGQLSIEIIEGSDHTFTPLWSQPVLIATLAAHLDELPRGRG